MKEEDVKYKENSQTKFKETQSKKAWTKLKNRLFGWRVVKKVGRRTEQTLAQVGSEQYPNQLLRVLFQ